MLKKILIILALGINFCNAQPPAPGSNIINNNINKFVGDWMWTSGSDTIVLKLRKYNTSFGNYTEDVLMGAHKYVKNGFILDNSLNRLDSISLNYKKCTIFLYQNVGSDTSKIQGSLKDLTKKKRDTLNLEFLGGNPITLKWVLSLPEGTYTDPNFQYGLTMPENIILTKL